MNIFVNFIYLITPCVNKKNPVFFIDPIINFEYTLYSFLSSLCVQLKFRYSKLKIRTISTKIKSHKWKTYEEVKAQ
jgi:hypothetical protein